MSTGSKTNLNMLHYALVFTLCILGFLVASEFSEFKLIGIPDHIPPNLYDFCIYSIILIIVLFILFLCYLTKQISPMNLVFYLCVFGLVTSFPLINTTQYLEISSSDKIINLELYLFNSLNNDLDVIIASRKSDRQLYDKLLTKYPSIKHAIEWNTLNGKSEENLNEFKDKLKHNYKIGIQRLYNNDSIIDNEDYQIIKKKYYSDIDQIIERYANKIYFNSFYNFLPITFIVSMLFTVFHFKSISVLMLEHGKFIVFVTLLVVTTAIFLLDDDGNTIADICTIIALIVSIFFFLYQTIASQITKTALSKIATNNIESGEFENVFQETFLSLKGLRHVKIKLYHPITHLLGFFKDPTLEDIQEHTETYISFLKNENTIKYIGPCQRQSDFILFNAIFRTINYNINQKSKRLYISQVNELFELCKELNSTLYSIYLKKIKKLLTNQIESDGEFNQAVYLWLSLIMFSIVSTKYYDAFGHFVATLRNENVFHNFHIAEDRSLIEEIQSTIDIDLGNTELQNMDLNELETKLQSVSNKLFPRISYGIISKTDSEQDSPSFTDKLFFSSVFNGQNIYTQDYMYITKHDKLLESFKSLMHTLENNNDQISYHNQTSIYTEQNIEQRKRQTINLCEQCLEELKGGH